VGKLVWQDCRRTPEELVVAHITMNVLFAKKKIATTNNGCNTYYYGKRFGMIICKHA
jgi:hypothetical protein